MQPDEGHKQTDAELRKLEAKIKQVYADAAKDMQETVDDYFDKFKARDAEMKALIGTEVNGKVWTEKDYQQWRLTQIARGSRYEAMRDKLAERATNANELAVAYSNDDMAKIYAMNHAYTIKSIKEKAGDYLADVDFTLFNEQAVKRLLTENPDLLPYYPKERAVKRGIDLEYGKKQINASVTSGILQGKSIGKMAVDLTKRISTMNMVSAIRTARTATTEAENAGRQAAADELEAKGVILSKEWVAIIDSRTRHAHIEANGQIVESSKPFTVGGEKLMYPGDRSGSPWNIYNCRCTRVNDVMGFKSVLTEEQRRKANIRVTVS